MEDSSFQRKVKCFLGKPPAVLFGSADQLSSEVLVFPFACFTWEIFLLRRILFFRDVLPLLTSRE